MSDFLLPKVKELYENGYSRVEIAKELGSTEGKIRHVIEKNNLIKGEKTNRKHQMVIQLYKSGKTQFEIAEIMNIKNNTVSWILTKNNIPTQKERKHKVDDNYFDSVDNPEKAYWLGFLYADGYVSSNQNAVGMRLSSNDENHLKMFLSDLNSTHPIYKNIQNSFGTETEYVETKVFSRKIKEDLIKLGCIKNKTLTLKFPNEEQVPKNLIYHFIRGYLDGDGSIYHDKKRNNLLVSFLGTKDMMEGIQSVFNTNVKIIPRQSKNTYYLLQYGGNIQTLKILDTIYFNCSRFLDRKFNKYINFKKTYLTGGGL